MVMTMRELAKLCNVSISTVSKAFLDADDVSSNTKKHIFEIAKENGCYGKFYKGKYHKKIIGIICPELEGLYYTGFITELKRLMEKSDCICLVSSYDFSDTKQAELIEYYASYINIDGLIVLGSIKYPLKKGYNIPIVSMLSSDTNYTDTVGADLNSAIFEAVDTLISYGHKKIAFIGENLTKGKGEIFTKAMKAHNFNDYEIITSGERFEKAGIDGVNQLFTEDTDFTGIICAYDNIAFGAIKQLKELGLKVPEDVSVIGIDNISTAKYSETTLTTIDTKLEEICSIAWDLMLKKLENKYYSSRQNITIKSKLIIRESIRKL